LANYKIHLHDLTYVTCINPIMFVIVSIQCVIGSCDEEMTTTRFSAILTVGKSRAGH